MELSHTLKALLLFLSVCFYSTAGHAEEQAEMLEGLETFFAISGVLGNTETDRVNELFQRIDSRDSFLDLNLEIQIRWKGLFYENPGRSQQNIDGLFSGDAVGYNFHNSRHWAFDIYAVNAFSDNEYTFEALVEERVASENAVLSRRYIDRLVLQRQSDYRLGVRATGYYDDYLAQFIVTPVSFRDEIGGFNASASLRHTWLIKNWNVYATVGVNYQSEDIIDYYFGLPAREAAEIAETLRTTASPFQQYEANDGFFGVGEVGFEYPLSESFVFGGFITAVMRPDAVKASPLSVSGRFATTAGVSVTWVY